MSKHGPIFWLVWCAFIPSAHAQRVELVDPEVLEELAAEERNSPFTSGIVLQTASQPGSDRIVSQLAFSSTTATSGVEWKGLLESNAEGKYVIAANFAGRLRVEVDGEVLLNATSDTVRWIASSATPLNYGQHQLRITLEPIDSKMQLATFWSGPGFSIEPIPAARLFHERKSAAEGYDEGAELVHAYRCVACHEFENSSPLLRVPNLEKLNGNLREEWLSKFLRTEQATKRTPWQAFHAQFRPGEASDVVAYLMSLSETPNVAPKLAGNKETGSALFLSLGCLACHEHGDVGDAGPFGGGDLTRIAQKRPAQFYLRWLQDPSSVNADHRMPEFELSPQEVADLAAFLMRSDGGRDVSQTNGPDPKAVTRGETLYADSNCSACHRIGETSVTVEKTQLNRKSSWNASCLDSGSSTHPNYSLASSEQRKAIHRFITASPIAPDDLAFQRMLLAESNCLGCHAREQHLGLTPTLQKLAVAGKRSAAQLPALLPPSLNSVGDKLHDKVLRTAIERKGKPHRDWLEVRMPRFPLSKQHLSDLADYFVSMDRIPAAANDTPLHLQAEQLKSAHRLVTSDGFGCTSCHSVGKLRLSEKTPLGQRGPDLRLLGERIRESWFHRWVKNPSRIVPKMEMPSVQIPVAGILDGHLDKQLVAVWQMLNQARFSPPDPTPLRVVRASKESAAVITDVFELDGSKYVKPFIVGLPNRHNVLIDLQSARLAAWWTGDVARQRTQGKSWFWDVPPGAVRTTEPLAEFLLIRNGEKYKPERIGQFDAELDGWNRVKNGVELRHRMRFAHDSDEVAISVAQQMTAMGQTGWRRVIRASGLKDGDQLAVRSTLESSRSKNEQRQGDYILMTAQDGSAALTLDYTVSNAVPVPEALAETPKSMSAKQMLDVMPGFRVTRLALRSDVMPISLAWDTDDNLLLGSLKGRVWRAFDTNEDQLEDELQVISDDLAAPYGLSAGDGFVDVVTKYGVVRLIDENGDGITDRHHIVASGWGHSDDYHDWAVGLPKDELGNYYVAIPCQQDERSQAAAKFRGKVLRLKPRAPDEISPRRYELEVVSGGHRFPMGIARNREGQLFVTDNQGNYNPFNELNHVLAGRRFGFINRMEQKPGFTPKLTAPAIDIPHPWTRSVNGICFLETPDETKSKSVFGPFEGHLIGCEYDTRRLIRMSLQEVDGVVQGAAYPLAIAKSDPSQSLQGPIACAVAPDGDVYVCNIRDSGWGGANNVGSVARIVPDFASLPQGIAEIRATANGFAIDFTRPVYEQLAKTVANYSVESYTRISTPVYGGDDIERRKEPISSVNVSRDRSSVNIELQLARRPGFVYEFRLNNLVSDGDEFFPSEGYFTLRKIPVE